VPTRPGKSLPGVSDGHHSSDDRGPVGPADLSRLGH
jgi:hypothetical protein